MRNVLALILAHREPAIGGVALSLLLPCDVIGVHFAKFGASASLKQLDVVEIVSSSRKSATQKARLHNVSEPTISRIIAAARCATS